MLRGSSGDISGIHGIGKNSFYETGHTGSLGMGFLFCQCIDNGLEMLFPANSNDWKMFDVRGDMVCNTASIPLESLPVQISP